MGGAARRFSGSVAVVTGGAAGIGRATAAMLGSEGASVAVLDLDAPAGQTTAAAIGSAGTTARFVHVDVRDAVAVEAAFEEVERELGPPRVLIHCAGGSRKDDAPVHELADAVLDATLELDLRGAVLCSAAAIRRMRRAGGGAVVHLSSFHALGGDSTAHAYVAAKGGVLALVRSLAARYAADGIRVNAIAPGIVLTDRVRARIEADGTDLTAVTDTHPGAVGDPDDIACIAVFLASDQARMITGSTIAADGGLTAF